MPRLHLRRLAVILPLALAACAVDSRKVDVRTGNLKALRSTVDRPVSGMALERAYWNPRFLDRQLGEVRVRVPVVRAEPNPDPEHGRFLEQVGKTFEVGIPEALEESERFAAVTTDYPYANAPTPAGTPEFECTVEAYAHVSPPGRRRSDPILHDPQPKLIAVVTVKETATGEVAFKYTQWEPSDWEYGSWAMDDLGGTKALKIAVGVREAFRMP